MPSVIPARAIVWSSAASSASASVWIPSPHQQQLYFQPRAEHAAEERRRHFVVLRVGERRIERDVRQRQLAKELGGGVGVGAPPAPPRLLAQPPRARLADPPAQHRVGQPAALGQRNPESERAHRAPSACGSRRGGHGTNALVVR
jgi:hypothetical protein